MQSGKLLLVVLLTAAILLAGCGDDRPAAPKLVNISVTATSTSPALGTATQVTATGTFSNGSTLTLTNVTWSTSNAAVATVSATGVITTKSQGTAVITATSGTATATITITVGPAVLAALSISPTTPSVALGVAQPFTVTGTMTDGTPASTLTLTWSSSNTAVATVANGIVTTKGQGTATITVTCGSITVSTTVTVTPPLIASVAVTPADPSISAGTTQQFAATATLTDSTTKDVTATATWHSGDAAVATLDATTAGLFHGASGGTAQITATQNGVTGGTSLTVTSGVTNAVAFVYATAFVQASATWELKTFAAAQDGTLQEIGSRTIDTITGRMVTDGARFMYIDAGNGGVLGFAINSVTGVLTPLPSYTPPQGTSVERFAMDPTSKRLYGFDAISASPAIKVLNIDQQTGVLTDSGLSFPIAGSALPGSGHQTGVFVATQNGTFFYFGGSLGQCATYGGSGPCKNLHGYVVDTVTGGLTAMAGVPFGSVSPQVWSVATSADQSVLWLSLDAYRIVSYALDPLTGLPSQIDYWFPLGQGSPIPAMVPRSNYFYAVQSTNLLWITPDPATNKISGTGTVWKVNTGQYLNDLAVFNPTSQLFVADDGGVSSYSLDNAGQPTFVMRAPFPRTSYVVVIGKPLG